MSLLAGSYVPLWSVLVRIKLIWQRENGTESETTLHPGVASRARSPLSLRPLCGTVGREMPNAPPALRRWGDVIAWEGVVLRVASDPHHPHLPLLNCPDKPWHAA